MKNVYLNGQFIPLSEAKISPMDRGFLFGDGVYEVIPVYAGQAFCLEEHLARLQCSLDGIRLSNPHSNEEWQNIFTTLIDDTCDSDQSLYLQVTRGEMRSRNHIFIGNETLSPTIFAMCSPLPEQSNEPLIQGASVITLADIRWRNCHLKVTSLMANVLLKQQAQDAGCVEALMVRDGMITEGSASNFFIVKAGAVITPPKNNEVLPGITRDLILSLAQENNIKVTEKPINLGALKSADEVWITSSTREILPITSVDNNAVGDGKIGPIWKKMNTCFTTYKNQLRAKHD